MYVLNYRFNEIQMTWQIILNLKNFLKYSVNSTVP